MPPLHIPWLAICLHYGVGIYAGRFDTHKTLHSPLYHLSMCLIFMASKCLMANDSTSQAIFHTLGIFLMHRDIAVVLFFYCTYNRNNKGVPFAIILTAKFEGVWCFGLCSTKKPLYMLDIVFICNCLWWQETWFMLYFGDGHYSVYY